MVDFVGATIRALAIPGSPNMGGAAMTCEDVLAQITTALQHGQHISYRTLMRWSALDGAYLDDL